MAHSSDRLAGFVSTLIRSGAPLELDTPLISSGLLESIQILDMVSFVEAEFCVQLAETDLFIENLDSMAAILALVERKKSL